MDLKGWINDLTGFARDARQDYQEPEEGEGPDVNDASRWAIRKHNNAARRQIAHNKRTSGNNKTS